MTVLTAIYIYVHSRAHSKCCVVVMAIALSHHISSVLNTLNSLANKINWKILKVINSARIKTIDPFEMLVICLLLLFTFITSNISSMQTLPRKAIEQYSVVVKKFEICKPKNQVKNQIVRYEKRKDHSLNLCQGNLWPEKKVKQVGEKGDEKKITCHMCVKRNVVAVVSTKPIKLWKKVVARRQNRIYSTVNLLLRLSNIINVKCPFPESNACRKFPVSFFCLRTHTHRRERERTHTYIGIMI